MRILCGKTQRKRSYLKDLGNISACKLKQIFPNILSALATENYLKSLAM